MRRWIGLGLVGLVLVVAFVLLPSLGGPSRQEASRDDTAELADGTTILKRNGFERIEEVHDNTTYWVEAFATTADRTTNTIGVPSCIFHVTRVDKEKAHVLIFPVMGPSFYPYEALPQTLNLRFSGITPQFLKASFIAFLEHCGNTTLG